MKKRSGADPLGRTGAGRTRGFDGETAAVANDPQWPPFHFVVNAAHILAEDAETNQLHAAQK